MGTERKALGTFQEWMHNQERRAAQQERRPQIYSATDLLGPGFGPTATQILDWNSEEASFTGFFWSPVGSINSPDGSEEWIGLTISQDDRRYGVQHLYSGRSFDPPLQYTRRFENPSAGATPTYTPWRGNLDWQTSGIATAGSCTITSQSWTKVGRSVSVTVYVTLTASISVGVTGNIGNAPLLQVPPDITPSGALLSQGLSGGAIGPLQGWAIGSDGIISLVAVSPSASLPSGAVLSVSGVYMV